MKFELKDGNLVATIPLAATPAPSKSGKTLVAASSGGFVATGVEHLGKQLKFSCNITLAR